MTQVTTAKNGELSYKYIFRTWWPLAASWILMGAELPFLSMIVARMADPEINLAAYGSFVFPVSLIIESPIIMLLAASTALSKDWASYAKLRRFMLTSGAVLTVLHMLVAFTPLYDLVVGGLLGAPDEVLEPARIGLMIMTPWTWSIAYRRFNQGMLIRQGYSSAIGIGTVVRLVADALVLFGGYFFTPFSGVVVATAAVSAGVMSEALYTGLRIRPVVRDELRHLPPAAEALTQKSFLNFYTPLALTSLLQLLVNPLGSAALSRMPQALESLAVWPVVMGLVFMLRGLGNAYNEVTVSLIDQPGSVRPLRRFALVLAIAGSLTIGLIAATPLSDLWFGKISNLKPHLAAMAVLGLWLGLPMPALTVLQSWYQGAILHGRRTRGVTEAVVVFLVTSALFLGAGVLWGQITGFYVGMAAFMFSNITQTLWLRWRSRAAMESVEKRDEAYLAERQAEAAD